ncbi:hypothetical protein Nhal_4010 (plasmid) [Nitrosococcus halophilus Nc 4]|uniref:Uncharacterized protein n=1 Tax=Nitrosococcus halophilus (strain Nc4) TaxID=472759 RepID=D5C5G4_NITHN|nr:hypothetical protein [Nitrosococcus halophilus]ADE17018.1 hypothetical protein Nhal_4010 [Nitrosococcus halophilus Nc 4]
MWEEIIRGLFILAVPCLGLYLYFRQKEYELIKQRYLEGAIDIIAAEVEQAFGIVNHNWARCLDILKMYRDEKDHFDVRELKKGFLDLDCSKFHRIPHYRIRHLIGSQCIWIAYQKAMVFTAIENTKITKEIPEAIRLKLTKDCITARTEELVNDANRELKEIEERSHKFDYLTEELHNLSYLLENQRFSLKGIKKFSEKSKVKDIVNRLHNKLATELENYDPV